MGRGGTTERAPRAARRRNRADGLGGRDSGHPHPDPPSAPGGRKLIMTSEGSTVPTPKPRRHDTLIKALVRAHGGGARSRAVKRSRSPTLRSRRARPTLMSAGSCPPLPSVGHCRSDPRRTAAKGVEACRCAREWTACLERPEGDLGLQQLTRSCSERFGLEAAQFGSKAETDRRGAEVINLPVWFMHGSSRVGG